MSRIRVTSPDGRTLDFDAEGMNPEQIKARATLVEAELARGAAPGEAPSTEHTPSADETPNWAQSATATIPKVGGWIGGTAGRNMLGPLIGGDRGQAMGEAVGGSLPGTPVGVGATLASMAAGPLGLGIRGAMGLAGLGGASGALAEGSDLVAGAAQGSLLEGLGRAITGGISSGALLKTASAVRKAVLPELQTFVAKLFGKANMVDEAGTPVAQLTQHAAARAAGKDLGPFGVQELLTGSEGPRVASAMWREGMDNVALAAGSAPIQVPSLAELSVLSKTRGPSYGLDVNVARPATPIQGGVAQPALGTPAITTAKDVLKVIGDAQEAMTSGLVPQELHEGARILLNRVSNEVETALAQGHPEILAMYQGIRQRYAQQMALRDLAKDAWKTGKSGAFDPNIPRTALMDQDLRTSLGKRFFPDPTRSTTDSVMVTKGKALYDELLDIFHAGEHTGAGGLPFVTGKFGLGGSFGSTGIARAFPMLRLPTSPRGPANRPAYTQIPRGLLSPPLQGLTNPSPE
jgi:hypothetical protein